MFTLQQAINWLQQDPDNAVKVSGFCVRTVDELNSDKSNWCMEIVGTRAEWAKRTNSFKKEIEEYPERCALINLNGNYDTNCNEEVTCPYCGHVHSDSWEFGDQGTINCNFCEKEFTFGRDISVS
jgi:hypothetical protein